MEGLELQQLKGVFFFFSPLQTAIKQHFEYLCNFCEENLSLEAAALCL